MDTKKQTFVANVWKCGRSGTVFHAGYGEVLDNNAQQGEKLNYKIKDYPPQVNYEYSNTMGSSVTLNFHPETGKLKNLSMNMRGIDDELMAHANRMANLGDFEKVKEDMFARMEEKAKQHNAPVKHTKFPGA